MLRLVSSAKPNERLQMEIMECAAFILPQKCKIKRRTAVVNRKNIVCISEPWTWTWRLVVLGDLARERRKKKATAGGLLSIQIYHRSPVKTQLHVPQSEGKMSAAGVEKAANQVYVELISRGEPSVQTQKKHHFKRELMWFPNEAPFKSWVRMSRRQRRWQLIQWTVLSCRKSLSWHKTKQKKHYWQERPYFPQSLEKVVKLHPQSAHFTNWPYF